VANRAEQRRRGRQESGGGGGGTSNTFYWVLAMTGALALLIVGWNLFSSFSAGGARAPVEFEYTSVEELVEAAVGYEAGDPDAPITLMDFSDYQCPACQQFALQTKPVVFRDYVEEGLVRFVYHDYLVGFPHSFLAARAARCAGDLGDYWAYHDMLYQMQPNWSGQADPFSNFVGYAADLGLDRGAFRSCLGSDEHARTVTANLHLADQLRVSGTPTLFLGTGEGRGERIEDWTTQGVVQAIEGALERLGYREAADPGDDVEDPPSS
jgi:hypothetical protein